MELTEKRIDFFKKERREAKEAISKNDNAHVKFAKEKEQKKEAAQRKYVKMGEIINKLEARFDRLRQSFEYNTDAELKVPETMHQNVLVEIAGKKYKNRSAVAGVLIKVQQSQLKVIALDDSEPIQVATTEAEQAEAAINAAQQKDEASRKQAELQREVNDGSRSDAEIAAAQAASQSKERAERAAQEEAAQKTEQEATDKAAPEAEPEAEPKTPEKSE